jgi:hypothetical protein
MDLLCITRQRHILGLQVLAEENLHAQDWQWKICMIAPARTNAKHALVHTPHRGAYVGQGWKAELTRKPKPSTTSMKNSLNTYISTRRSVGFPFLWLLVTKCLEPTSVNLGFQCWTVPEEIVSNGRQRTADHKVHTQDKKGIMRIQLQLK